MSSFAVVVPAYAAADWVAEAIESALDQTRPAEEIFVVDDGSPDDQHQVISRYERHIQYIRRPTNGGEAAAKNTGVEMAKSDFVVTLDADDAWLPDRLAAIEERSQLAPAAGIITTDAWVERSGTVLGRYYSNDFWETTDQRMGILDRDFIFSHAAVRRNLWLSVGGMDESRRDVCADWPLWVKLVLRGVRAELIREPLARYRLVEGSLSSSRLTLARTNVAALQAALGTSDASEAERERARQGLRDATAWVRYEQAFSAFYQGEPYRWLACRLALARGTSKRARVKAVAAIGAPEFTKRRLGRSMERTVATDDHSDTGARHAEEANPRGPTSA